MGGKEWESLGECVGVTGVVGGEGRSEYRRRGMTGELRVGVCGGVIGASEGSRIDVEAGSIGGGGILGILLIEL